MAGNPDFNSLLSTTLQNYQPTLVDNIFKDLVLLNHLNERGRVRVEEGGTQIIEPLLYGVNDTVATYSGYDAIDLTPQEGISAAEYDWKQMAASIAISGIEEAKNRGTEAIIKLLNAKIMQAEMSLKTTLNEQLFGSASAGTDFNGLGNIVATQNNTVGGIDASTNTWWNPTQGSTMGATLALQNMADVYNRASKGSDVPDLIITNTSLFEKYESLLTNQVRYQDVAKANAGFQNLMFKQTPVVFDLELAVDTSDAPMYFLNTKYLKLTGMNNYWFKTTDFMNGTVAGVDARYALVLAYGQLTCSNRARQGYLTADAVYA
ncbi:MAG: phage major capsid protein [Burkholderiaceae bacterium]|jgi:hypothetical protein|nr:phage major capsid protein [Burkholderiaceae bacterium]